MSITDPLIGRKLGDYAIQEILGQGGMARVYKGYDEKLDRFAAVKIIDAHLVARETESEYRERFRREARAIARLNHTNIVKIYQFGEEGSLYYMAMEYVSGRDLRQIIKDHTAKGETMPYEEVMRVINDITSALDYAHKEGVIHRDVKPSNIMVTPTGQSVLMDFGLALSVPEGTLGSTFGSVHYIAPEQAVSSARAVPQSDLYSLGIVLYEMLTGRVPFDDQSTMSVALKHLSDPPPALTSLNPNILPQIEVVVLKTLDKEPRKRFNTGNDLARALEFAFGFNLPPVNLDDQWGTEGSRPAYLYPSKPSRPTSSDPLYHNPTNKVKPATGTMEDSPTISEPVRPSRANRPSISSPQPVVVEEKSSQNRIWIVVGVIVAALLVGGGALFAFLSSNQNNNVTPTAMIIAEATETEEATAEAVVPSSTPRPSNTPRPTPTPTEEETETVEPTETPTRRPTNTPRPTATDDSTETPTADETAEVTVPVVIVPSATPTPEDTAARLYYDHRTLVIVNTSEEMIDISDLFFVRTDQAGQTYEFESNNWTGNESTLTTFRHESCLQVWTTDFNILAEDSSVCPSRQGWRQLTDARLFWVSDEDEATFEVRRGTSRVLAVCPASPSRGTADFEFECALDVSR